MMRKNIDTVGSPVLNNARQIDSSNRSPLNSPGRSLSIRRKIDQKMSGDRLISKVKEGTNFTLTVRRLKRTDDAKIKPEADYGDLQGSTFRKSVGQVCLYYHLEARN